MTTSGSGDEHRGCPVTPRVSRRSFLAGAGGVGAVVGAGTVAACTAGPGGPSSGGSDGDVPSAAQVEAGQTRYVPFAGPHQTGVTAVPVPVLGLMASFDCVADSRDELRRCLREMTDEIRGLMAGDPIEERDPEYPPVDSGLLGLEPPADNLSIVVSVGSSLFDDRYGLADRRPVELERMPFLANDRLDPERTHGDILVTIDAENPDTVAFALRQVMRRTRRWLVLHWMVDGYTRGTGPVSGGGAPRNLMGFRDGTANLDPTDTAVMDRYVWVAESDTVSGGGLEPDWTLGGSYHAVRVIRMLVEFWDRTRLSEQEAIMGRQKVSGAPLGMAEETDVPSFADDPDGEVTPLDAHIRLANPRTPEGEESLIFRRGFSFSRGFDRAGQLDQGLAFACYQRSLGRGFLAVQGRLTGEPLEEYILPVGGGFFFALPGVESESGYLGESLLA